MVHTLKEHDSVARIHFYSLFLQSVYEEVDPHLVFFFCNEAWFLLRGEVNSQNIRYWSAENPGVVHELTILDEKNWCLVSGQELQRVSNVHSVRTATFSTSAVAVVSFCRTF